MSDATDYGASAPSMDFDHVFSSSHVAIAMKDISQESYAAAAEFWRVPFAATHLTARMKELILFAMHVSATSLNGPAIKRQVDRVRAAGGSEQDIVDVVTTIASLANHSLYASVPVLEEELAAAGKAPPRQSEIPPALEAVKRRFIAIRGFWNAERDPLVRQMPDYFAALSGISTVSWELGPLTRKERELVCIGIDCTVTHTYTPGLRIHIRNAIAEGATREEMLEVFQLAALMGLEGYVLAAEAMFAPA